MKTRLGSVAMLAVVCALGFSAGAYAKDGGGGGNGGLSPGVGGGGNGGLSPGVGGGGNGDLNPGVGGGGNGGTQGLDGGGGTNGHSVRSKKATGNRGASAVQPSTKDKTTALQHPPIKLPGAGPVSVQPAARKSSH